MTTTLLTPAQVAKLTPADIISVYSGRDGRCCCGCSGQHRINSQHVKAVEKDRGFLVETEEINDKQVKRVLKIVQEDIAKVSMDGKSDCYLNDNLDHKDTYIDGTLICTVRGTRLYLVYLLPK